MTLQEQCLESNVVPVALRRRERGRHPSKISD
jgi:hypothetical protein